MGGGGRFSEATANVDDDIAAIMARRRLSAGVSPIRTGAAGGIGALFSFRLTLHLSAWIPCLEWTSELKRALTFLD